MPTRPDAVLDVPKPAWWTEDIALLRELAERFSESAIVPHYERFEAQEMVDRALWNKAGDAGLLCAQIPEVYGGCRGPYGHHAALHRAFGRHGGDVLGLPRD